MWQPYRKATCIPVFRNLHCMIRFTAVVLIIITIIATASCKKGNSLSIGDSYQGGIIFYIDNTGEHGLIAAPSDQSAGIKWSNGNDTVRTTATGIVVGTGKPNTRAIVDQLGPGNYAAILCDQLVLNGYDDWFLPSQDELKLLYDAKDKIGGFVENTYWGSTDLLGWPYAYYAINLSFLTGKFKMNLNMNKPEPNRVRAIRSF